MAESRLEALRITKWRSALGPSLCPYENRLRPARWFFYRRFSAALEAAGRHPVAKVLDFGCWEGHFLPSLLANYEEVWAVENDCASCVQSLPDRWTILENARDLARAEGIRPERLHLAKADGCSLPFRSGTFDAVFCLDSLPYTLEENRPAAIAEIRRILKTTGRAVFTLPIEVGPAVLLREALRRASGHWLDGYALHELTAAARFNPVRQHQKSAHNLIGYDYRPDMALIDREFAIGTVRFLPWNWTRWVSPTVLLGCRPLP